MRQLTRLGVCEAAALLAQRKLSSSELVAACLARIHERDGAHSHDGDPASVNAWVRVYEEEAIASRSSPTSVWVRPGCDAKVRLPR